MTLPVLLTYHFSGLPPHLFRGDSGDLLLGIEGCLDKLQASVSSLLNGK